MNVKAKQNLKQYPKLSTDVSRTDRIKLHSHKEENYSTPDVSIAFPEQCLLLLQLSQPVWAEILFPYLKKLYDGL